MAAEYFFLDLIENLKNTLRRGWYLHNVPNPESVSDHMYRMAIMCMLVRGIDDSTRTKAVYLALIHDMGETIVGDIAPADGISQEQKYVREEMAFKYLACTLRSSHPDFANSMIDLWKEYEEGKTKAAVLVRQIDKLECLHQAVLYEERNGIDLSEFMSQKKYVTLPELTPLLDTCLQKHEEVVARRQAGLSVIFVSGGPGVSKGAQCTLLAEEFGLHHISVGDLLREEAKQTTSPYRDFILESIEKSVLIPAQLTTQLISQEISRVQAQGKRGFLLDGFPRSVAQAVDFEHKVCNSYATIALDCSETELRQRLEHRSTSSDRIDDNPDSIVRRLQNFNENNAEVLQHLQTHGPVFKIECRGSIDEVYGSVRPKVQEFFSSTK